MSIHEVRIINTTTGTIGITIQAKTAEALGIKPGTKLWINWAQIIEETNKVLELKEENKSNSYTHSDRERG